MSGDPKDEKGQSSQVIPVEERALQSPDELYREGSSHFKARDYAAARGCFERYTAHRPDDPAGFHFLARVYYHQNKHLDKAEECIKKALELSTGANETHYLETLGIIYIHGGQYEKAEEVFAYALSEDRGGDKKHTYSLEFYLNLVRKKIKKKPKSQASSAPPEPPQFLKTGISRRREHSRQTLFLIPSAVIHALMLLLVWFLSTHDIAVRQEKDDFTFIDIAQEEPEQAFPEEAPKRSQVEREQPAGQEPQEEAQPVPAPVTPRQEAEAGGVQKGGGPAKGKASSPERAGQGLKQQAGGKQAAKLESAARTEDMAAKAAGEKALGLKTPRPTAASEDVEFARRDLGAGPEQAAKGAVREASAGRLSERSATVAASDDGIFFGEKKQEKESRFDKSRKAGLGGGRTEEGASGKSLGEKKLTVASLDRGIKQYESQFKPSALNIGGISQREAQGRAGEAFGSVDRSQAARAQGAAQRFEPGAGERAPVAGGKVSGSLGVPIGTEAPSQGMFGGEKRTHVASAAGGRREYAPGETPGARRSLDIASRGAMPGQAAGGNPSFGSLDGKAQAPARSQPGAGMDGMAAPGSGGGAQSASGKGAAKNLSSSKEEGFPGAGFLEKAADRVSQALGIGSGSGGTKMASMPDADLRRAKSLGISPGGGQTGGAGGGRGSGTGNGYGSARIGGGEKAQPSLSGIRADEGAGRQAAADAAGIKRMSDSPFGAPGGSADRFASHAKGEVKAAAPEKRPVVPARQLMAKNSLGPSVSISSPRSGQTDRLSQVISGRVSDPFIKKATLTVNNDSRVVSVQGGSFESAVSLSKGRNTVTVMAFDAEGNVGKDSVTLDYSEPREGAPVTIVSPKDGQVFDVSEQSIISVKGTIGDQDVRRAKLIFNGNPIDISVNRGYFDQKVALQQEQNTVLVEAHSPEGKVSRSQLVHVNTVNVKPKDLMVILTWDKPRADFDLHVYGPGGGHTSYKTPNIYESREAIPGAQLEQDAKGNFGPEVFTQQRADKGLYSIVSNYYYSGGDGNAYATVTVILYGDNPSRRIVRVFGPHLQVDTKSGEDNWEVAKLRMPEGIFLEE